MGHGMSCKAFREGSGAGGFVADDGQAEARHAGDLAWAGENLHPAHVEAGKNLGADAEQPRIPLLGRAGFAAASGDSWARRSWPVWGR